MKLQKQLDTTYHADRYLRYQLLIAVDVPHIVTSLRQRIPRASEQAISRTMNRLSYMKKSAGSAVSLFTDTPILMARAVEKGDEDEGYDEASYTLGQSYNGQAVRNVNPL